MAGRGRALRRLGGSNAVAFSWQLVRRWQECVRAGIEATQTAGEADPTLDADRTAAAVIAAVQGGVTVLLSTAPRNIWRPG